MEDKIREVGMRWLRHVKRRTQDAPVVMCDQLVLMGRSRGRGRSKKYRGGDQAGQLQLTKDMTLY